MSMSKNQVYGWVCLMVGIVFAAGCSGRDPGDATVAQSTSSGPREASVVELYDPRVWLEDDNMARFEVKYRFTQGKPVHHYQAEVRFPGTGNAGVKGMANWEMKEEGVIRDGIYIDELPIDEFEMELKEAFVPQDGFFTISNLATGRVDSDGPESASDEAP
jgi:hypothetical protein